MCGLVTHTLHIVSEKYCGRENDQRQAAWLGRKSVRRTKLCTPLDWRSSSSALSEMTLNARYVLIEQFCFLDITSPLRTSVRLSPATSWPPSTGATSYLAPCSASSLAARLCCCFNCSSGSSFITVDCRSTSLYKLAFHVLVNIDTTTCSTSCYLLLRL